MRLGLLRHNGEAVTNAVAGRGAARTTGTSCRPWCKLNPRAAAFSAYRTFSVLGSRFLPIELAVRTILSQVSSTRPCSTRSPPAPRGEHIELPKDLVERIDYMFVGE